MLPRINANDHPFSRQATNEKEQYGPFIEAFNHALQGLRPLGTHYLKPHLVKHDIVFCRNDPQELLASYSGNPTVLKPDVVLTTFRGLCLRRDIEPEDHAKLSEIVGLAHLAPPPSDKFSWSHTLSTQEFKFETKISYPLPVPYSKSDRPREEIPHFSQIRAYTRAAGTKGMQ